MTIDHQGLVRTRFGRVIDVLRRRLVGAGYAQAAVDLGIIVIAALFVLGVAAQFAFTGEAAEVAALANFTDARSTTINPAASQFAVPVYLTKHVDDAFRA